MASSQESPALSLAKRIAARLKREKLLSSDRFDRFNDSLASGKLKESDWRLALESVLEPTKKPKNK
jgi:hypothetical protein